MVRRFPTAIKVANNPKQKLYTMFHELKSITEGIGSWRCLTFVPSEKKKEIQIEGSNDNS